MEKEVNQCDDLIIKAAIKKKIKFKAGSDLSGRVNLKSVDISVDKASTEDSETFEFMIHFKGCANMHETEESVS